MARPLRIPPIVSFLEGNVMKRFLLVCVAIVALQAGSNAQYQYGPEGVSFDVFYSSLEPHGEWIVVDRGIYAWRPFDTFAGWRPYTVGRWAWTTYGWYWVSDEPWGWATYHYGRWYYDDFYGWLWMPGYEWAPAWVEWRSGGPYVGWAPLGPYALFSITVGIHYRYRWVTPVYYWTFIDCRHVATPSLHRYVYRSDDNRRYIGRTRSIGSVRSEQGRIITRGPDREYVERQGRIRIASADVVDIDNRQERISRSGDREKIEAYRPRITEASTKGTEIRPSRVREGDRKVNLDVQRTDIRKSERDRGVDREAGVREESRPQRGREVGSVEPGGAERRSGPQEVHRVPREDRGSEPGRQSVEKEKRSGRESVERPDTERRVGPQRRPGDSGAERKREELRQPSPRKEETRSASPGRTVRRPEARTPERKPEQKPDQKRGDPRR